MDRRSNNGATLHLKSDKPEQGDITTLLWDDCLTEKWKQEAPCPFVLKAPQLWQWSWHLQNYTSLPEDPWYPLGPTGHVRYCCKVLTTLILDWDIGPCDNPSPFSNAMMGTLSWHKTSHGTHIAEKPLSPRCCPGWHIWPQPKMTTLGLRLCSRSCTGKGV